jgi:NAD(P)-dependent dehydrogenase (short-subunit alcohol dehydrogenase family)
MTKKIFEGRVVVVTGSGSGIGRAEAKLFAQYGAKVVVNDIGTSIAGEGKSNDPADTVVKAIKDAGGDAIPNYDSVADEQGANKIIKAAVDKWGRIDVLVNNAAVFGEMYDVYDVKTEDFDKIMKVCVYGTFFCTRAAAGYMKKQGYGRIINTSSHTGFGWRGNTPYSGAKEAIAGMTRTMARDMAEWGGTVNAIRPIAAWRGTRPRNLPGKEKSPSLAVSLPEDIAPLVVYLCSEAAGEINGRIFEVWHGHVGIFVEPPVVQGIILKQGSWTVEELEKLVPQKLARNASRTDFPEIKMFDFEQ